MITEKPFNNLTPAEVERIALLMEECGEVVQICGKILRHGYDSWHPEKNSDFDNRQELMKELGDVGAALELMRKSGDVGLETIASFRKKKLEKVGHYLHHNSLEETVY